MAKSQINQLSKRQILESLFQEQNQSNVTLSRLITSVARALGLDPLKLAEFFIDDKGNQEFVDKFNQAVREKHAAAHQTAAGDAMGSGEEPAAEQTTEETPNEEEKK